MKINRKELIRWALGILALICLYLITVLSFWFYSKDRIYPGVSVAGVSFSGKTKTEAENVLNKKINQFSEQEIVILGESPKSVKSKDLGVTFDAKASVKKAFNFGNRNPFVLGLKKDFDNEVEMDDQVLFKQLLEIDGKTSTAIVNAKLEKSENQIKVIEGKAGKRLNYAETAFKIKKAVSKMETRVEPVEFEVNPSFAEVDLLDIKSEIATKTENSFLLKIGGQAITVPSESLVNWVELSSNNRALSEIFEAEIFTQAVFKKTAGKSIFSDNQVRNYLLELSKKIDTEPVNAKLGIVEEKVTVTTSAQKGQTLQINESTRAVIEALDKKESETELIIKSKEAEVSEEKLANLGLSELLSTGYSNFAGSPTNRIHNIKAGAGKFNGILIKPNERFSFNTALGPVDAEHGFLPELVIKENKTVPEFGGGMCQVSSTAFRAALNAGLPILERKAHSYPVVYYKPYGVDATIYLPKPDLVFKNDTEKYIFIQTKVVGSRLTFDFYGTKPNRTVSFAGAEDGTAAVEIVEKVNPAIWDQEVRGRGSFTAAFYRFLKDQSGKIIKTDNFVSKYDSPDKYPH